MYILSFQISQLVSPNTARKTIFSFSRRPEKMVFPKKLRWNMIFLVLWGKMIFLFPENMILPPGRKWKMIFLKKIHENMIFSSNVLKKSVALGHVLSCTTWGGGISSPKTRYFFPGWKMRERWPFSRHTRKHDIFNLICSTPPAEKNQRWSYPAKIHLKVINTLDWHARKSSSNSLYLRGDLYRRFHILLSN